MKMNLKEKENEDKSMGKKKMNLRNWIPDNDNITVYNKKNRNDK